MKLVEADHESIDLSETGFVVFDFETTGAKTPPCRVTRSRRVQGDERRDSRRVHTLVNPEMPIPLFISMLTGISDAMVRTAPKFEEVASGFLEFIGDSVLVAHNAGFDLRFLDHEVGRVYEDYRVAESLAMHRSALAKAFARDQQSQAKDAGRALQRRADKPPSRERRKALATAKIFINLLEGLKGRGSRISGPHKDLQEKVMSKQAQLQPENLQNLDIADAA